MAHAKRKTQTGMIETKNLKENLQSTTCYKCGFSLEDAKLIPISEAPLALIAHAVCSKCRAESMLTITAVGNGVIPLVSDLKGEEIKKFLGTKSVSFDELLDLHEMLEKESLWNLLHKPEQVLEKNLKI